VVSLLATPLADTCRVATWSTWNRTRCWPRRLTSAAWQ
jgi:hypothetical protein